MNKKNKVNLSSLEMMFTYNEAYKVIRTNLEYISNTENKNSYIVTSTFRDEGKSTVTIGLAKTLAANGKKVIIVECDLRKPVMSSYLNLSQLKNGLVTYLKNNIKIDDCIYKIHDNSISIMPAGEIPDNPSELLGNSKMSLLIETLKNKYDYVLLDTPPVLVVADAAILGRIVDGALFVIRSRYAAIKDINMAKQNLENIGVKVYGAILTRYNTKKEVGKTRYYYSSGYGNIK